MRRIPPAIGPVLALVAMTAPVTPAHAVVPHDAESSAHVTHARATTSSSRARIGLDTASLGTSFVHVSWNWIKAASGYRVQVSKTKDFSAVVTTQKKRNSSRRPTGGREATTVGHLKDASYYWVRVRKVKHGHASRWSAPARVATRAHAPDRITGSSGVRGSVPGTTRIRWASAGGHTDFFKITTALTPFGSKSSPGPGRHRTTFKASGNRRSLTLTPAMAAEAGAGLGTGNHLFYRITAVRSGVADSKSRPYRRLMHTTIAGERSTGTGSRLRFGQYNMRIQSHDVPGHLWRDRASLIAKNIASVHPAVVSLQELLPPMWTSAAGGPGLDQALKNQNAGDYRLTRTTKFAKTTPGDSRILYDPNVVQLVSNCDPTTISCLIPMPVPGRTDYASYAEFKDIDSRQQFYFVSAHLSNGNNATTDALRGRQARAIIARMAEINQQDLPVIFGGDFNSAQNSKGSDAPHRALLDAGWYNASAAAAQVNLQYNSVNNYVTHEKPSAYGFGALYDTLMTLHLPPGADVFKIVRTGKPWPSDHNMVYADLRLP